MEQQVARMIFKLNRELKKIMKSERGVALMMILTAIVLLMAVYGEFTFDSKISRLKATNILDRAQAKLLAESGLQLAMARLRLYKEAANYVAKNENAKSAVPPQLINQLWEVPFIYPIPVTKGASRSFRDTVEKFQTESLVEGEFRVNIQNISNRMNLNLLRMDMTKMDPNEPQDYSVINPGDVSVSSDVSVHQTLYALLRRLVEEKKEKDEAFEDRNGALNYQEMITNLKYFISDQGSLMQDPLAGEAEQTFQKIPLTPKYGPMSSASELYAIPGWNDELIELIQNEFSVYPSAQIDFNKLTANMFRILIPNATEDDVKDFFIYRDDPQQPKFFNTLADFKKYIVDYARLMNEATFDERMKKFIDKGISFGSTPNLFKVISEGIYNRSTYTLVAYVVLPKTETPQQKPKTNPDGTPIKPAPGATNPDGTPANNPNHANQSAQLLEPKIIEIQIN